MYGDVASRSAIKVSLRLVMSFEGRSSMIAGEDLSYNPATYGKLSWSLTDELQQNSHRSQQPAATKSPSDSADLSNVCARNNAPINASWIRLCLFDVLCFCCVRSRELQGDMPCDQAPRRA